MPNASVKLFGLLALEKMAIKGRGTGKNGDQLRQDVVREKVIRRPGQPKKSDVPGGLGQDNSSGA